jgi:hypothetical protein
LWSIVHRVYDRAAPATLQLPYRILARRAASTVGAKLVLANLAMGASFLDRTRPGGATCMTNPTAASA